ncbi:uncharacterized protein LOC118506003 isoform X2 [Anopheles stephensi]|nr:uncharacterized protein LOC118506003 isoform X2 [Anopheles stephensi]
MALQQAQTEAQHIKNVLKPWTKEPMTKCWDWCSPMLDGESLTQLYKCMGSYCSFTTNDTCAMVVHLQNHEDLVDILRCAYCVATFPAINELIAHIKLVHGQCRYQCSYCFYRALDAANVFNHQKIYHSEDRSAAKSIIELALHHEIVGVDYMNAAVRGKVRQKLLKCTVCNQHFLAISYYIQHIKTVHQGTTVSCCWCQKKIMKDNAASHLLTHYIGTYECLYCDYACNIKQMMQRHLGNVHASKPMFCSKRREAMDSHLPKRKYLLDLREIVPAEYVKSLDSGFQTENADTINSKTSAKEVQGEQPLIPKILNIHGGIKLTDKGAVLTAQQTLPSVQMDKTLSDARAGVSMAPARNVSVRGTADSFTVPKFKRAKLDRSIQKLCENSNITLSKSSKQMPHSGAGMVTLSKVPEQNNVRESEHSVEVGQSRTAENNTNCHNTKPTTFLTTSSARAKSVEGKTTESSAELVKHTMTYSEHTQSSANAKRNTYVEDTYKVKQISFRLTEYTGDLDLYYRQLSICMNKTKITARDINACGINTCALRFETHNALFQHMKTGHGILTIETPITIVCTHCALQLNNVSNYLYHLSVHSLNQYACFVCCYKHFLLTNVVTHMNEHHSCTSVQLSFAHPAKMDILSDIILVMPGTITAEEKRNCIQNTIKLGDHLTHSASAMSKPLLRPVRTYTERTAKSYTYKPHFSLLYKCGLCSAVETSKLAFQKHLLQECPNNKRSYYNCAHCNKMFKDWTTNLESIIEHLYFHGENLYACGNCAYYHYLFENVAAHIIKSAFHSAKCEIKVLRESAEQWECNVCRLKSSFRQTVMEHMQNVHDLPGERFMCSLCNMRMLTKEKSIRHFKENHPNQDVVMIEMYHEAEVENSSNNDDTDSVAGSDASSDLQIIDDVIESFSLSSASDHGDDGEDAVSELGNDDLDDLAEHNLRRKCPVLREHNYCRMACSEIPLTAKVKNENGKQPTELMHDSSATGNVVTESNEPCVDSSAIGADDGASNAVGNSTEEISDSAAEPDDATATDSEILQSLSPSTVMSVLSMERRASRRVAVKKDITSRWINSTKYGCIFCDNSFEHYKSLHMHARIVHGTVSRNFLRDSNADGVAKQAAGASFTGFRLFCIARCFYCDKQDTYAALRMHHDKKHDGKTFVCLDFWNPMKCGLCAYLNGSGNEKDFSHHFQQFHTTISKRYASPYDHIDDSFIQWALTLGKKLTAETEDELKILKYICGTCAEKCDDELRMGMHVASHVLKFHCDYCTKSFRELKALYEHIVMIHRVEEYDPPAAASTASEQMLLDVQMCFINGFILSKREAQFTSHGSLQVLEEGYQKYIEGQLSELDSYKTMLSTMIEANTTCKAFLQNQTTHPVVMLLPVDGNTSEEES